MRKTCIALLCLLLWGGCGAALGERPSDRTIVLATDLHYLSPTLTDYGPRFMRIIEGADGKITHYTPQLARAFVRDMLSLQPDAVILSGDLTLNGAPASHRELTEILRPLVNAGIKVLSLPGNHDTESSAFQFTPDGPVAIAGTPNADFAALYADFGYASALDRDSHSLSYVAELFPDVWALMLDVNGNSAPGVVTGNTLRWLEEKLRQAQQDQITVIGVSHQNVMPHNPLFVTGFAIANYEKVLALYRQYGVRLNLSGHMHIQHIAQAEGIVEIATESMAVAPCPYGVLRLQGQEALSYDTKPVDVAGWALENGETNPDLLNFPAYAADFFERTTRQKSTFTSDVIPAEDLQRMIDLVTQLNVQYFSGTRKPFDGERDIALWQTYLPRNFTTYYLQTILDEPARDMNHFSFQEE
ncbi:MAG: metallophosphoesterase [Clostridia bacterium]|nr:metallophosphoesterase [Clostridia bacterium]